VASRINDALARMTVDEKVNELCESWGIPGVKRLGIPPFSKSEGVHGLADGTGATVFPAAIGLAATFDTNLESSIGDAEGQEFVDANLSQSWSPVLDVARDARWGRVEETFGEDPYLVTRMGVSWIEAFQSHNLIATPKHFAAHGGPLGGRDSNDVGYSERVMREVYLPSFRAAFEEAHAGAVMNAYSTWTDGLPNVESKSLMTDVLRQEWGFKGFVVSDCGAVENMLNKYSVVQTGPETAALALKAGVSCNCGDAYKKWLKQAYETHLVTMNDLDLAVANILYEQYRLGLIDKPLGPKNETNAPGFDSENHRALAAQAARESIVLLKNDNSLLPLSKSIKSIAVIGPNADVPQTGDYSGKLNPGQAVSDLDAIKSEVSPGTVVNYARGCDWLDPSTDGFAQAVAAAAQSDVVVMVLGDLTNKTTGENIDRANLDLTGVQEQLLEAVAKTGRPIVLVLVSGKPCTINWAASNIPAILESWYPGELGGTATADVLFGNYNPAGRLPITFPVNSNELPLTYDYAPSGRKYSYTDESFIPLFRFGYGLSYTKFAYSNLRVTPPRAIGGDATVSADVTNTGALAGDEVAQLYISHTYSSVVTPVMQLRGFSRIHLEPNQTKTVTFLLSPYSLSILNSAMDRVVETGPVKIMVGGSSPLAQIHDGQKQNVGFASSDQGVVGELNISQALAANFVSHITAPPIVSQHSRLQAIVNVTNKGNLTDTGEVKMYVDGRFVDTQHFELRPGQTKPLPFEINVPDKGTTSLAAVGKYSMAVDAMTVK
jgi:beta-glucosidase